MLRLLSKNPIKCAFYVSLPFFLCHNCAYLFVAVCIHITYIISSRLKASNNRAQSKYSTALTCPGGNLQWEWHQVRGGDDQVEAIHNPLQFKSCAISNCWTHLLRIYNRSKCIWHHFLILCHFKRWQDVQILCVSKFFYNSARRCQKYNITILLGDGLSSGILL